MTPVAGGITDAEEDGLVLSAGFGEGLLSPGEPIDGIVLVLEKVGRLFAGKPVGVSRLDGWIRHGYF